MKASNFTGLWCTGTMLSKTQVITFFYLCNLREFHPCQKELFDINGVHISLKGLFISRFLNSFIFPISFSKANPTLQLIRPPLLYTVTGMDFGTALGFEAGECVVKFKRLKPKACTARTRTHSQKGNVTRSKNQKKKKHERMYQQQEPRSNKKLDHCSHMKHRISQSYSRTISEIIGSDTKTTTSQDTRF